MRLFVALDIQEAMRESLLGFACELRAVCPELRWVPTESWHVTLKFLGEIPQSSLDAVTGALLRVECETIDLRLRGYGFFPKRKPWRTFAIGVEPNGKLMRLEQAIGEVLSGLGVRGSEHSFRPHLTLARRGAGSSGADSNGSLEGLQEKLMSRPTPEFGTLSLREFWLYQSELSASGSRYSKLQQFALI